MENVPCLVYQLNHLQHGKETQQSTFLDIELWKCCLQIDASITIQWYIYKTLDSGHSALWALLFLFLYLWSDIFENVYS